MDSVEILRPISKDRSFRSLLLKQYKEYSQIATEMEKEAKAIADKKVKPFVHFLDRLLALNRFRNFRLKSHKVDFSIEPYSKDRDDMLENPGYNFYVSVELELM